MISIVISVAMIPILGFVAVQLGVFEEIGQVFGVLKFDLNVIVQSLLAVAFVVAVSNVLSLILRFIGEKGGRIGTLSSVLASLIKYVAVIGGACWVLSIIGVNVSTIFASLGIVALILGFGAESLIADLVTGVFILFENQYNVGDIIEVDGFCGTVKEISILLIKKSVTGKVCCIKSVSSIYNKEVMSLK